MVLTLEGPIVCTAERALHREGVVDAHLTPDDDAASALLPSRHVEVAVGEGEEGAAAGHEEREEAGVTGDVVRCSAGAGHSREREERSGRGKGRGSRGQDRGSATAV